MEGGERGGTVVEEGRGEVQLWREGRGEAQL